MGSELDIGQTIPDKVVGRPIENKRWEDKEMGRHLNIGVRLPASRQGMQIAEGKN
jgi:hypothetical protein